MSRGNPGLPQLWVAPEEAGSKLQLTLHFDDKQCGCLADRCDLAGVRDFSMRATAQRQSGGKLLVEGSVEATVGYVCSQTLLPFDAAVNEVFEQTYWPEKAIQSGEDVELDAFAADDPEPLHAKGADVAELAFQHFSLAIDRYPRHPDAEPMPAPDPLAAADEASPEASQSPFAVLAQLRGQPDR
ncbi:MAG: DUF177 domain-containing protein [Pseudomonadota bacterium]